MHSSSLRYSAASCSQAIAASSSAVRSTYLTLVAAHSSSLICMDSIVGAVNLKANKKERRWAIDFFKEPAMQREIPMLSSLTEAAWIPADVVAGWSSLRDAVAWCWASQRHYIGIRDQARQALFANAADMHAPHVSRCVKRDSKAPMDLPDRAVNTFETFTGWRGIRQWQMRDAGLTVMEQVIAERKAA